jgi:dienelactone hydrolase
MQRCIPFFLIVLCVGKALAASSQPLLVVIDGEPNETFWQKLVSQKLVPAEAGVPAEVGGEIRAAMAGRYLYVAARLPEPTGRVTARSIGRNPVWEGGGEARQATSQHEYDHGAPEGEDCVRFFFRVSRQDNWMVQIGPLGGYSVKWTVIGEREWYTTPLDKSDRFLVAAHIGEREWSVEAAIPLDQLASPLPGQVRLSVERNRAMRPGQPGEQWHWPQSEPTTEVPTLASTGPDLADPVFDPPVLGNRDPPIEVGFRKELPPLDANWTDPGWRDVPVWTLRRNKHSAREPQFPTQVKLIHNGHTLAAFARCYEPDRVIAQAQVRDGQVDQDDSFQVYLAVSGSSYVQYAINPNSYLRDAAGHSGNPRSSEPHVEWNSPVRSTAWQERGEWFARMDLPLAVIADVLAEPGIGRRWRILLLRNRPGRDGEPEEISVLPVTQSGTPFCPARYRSMELVDKDPSELPNPQLTVRTGELVFVPSRVFSKEQRAKVNLSGMMESYLRSRTLNVLEADKQAWDEVRSLPDWEHFRNPRVNALREMLGPFPKRCPLQVRITDEFRGDGYRRDNLVYQSQPGMWVTANLYLPNELREQMPGIIIIHSHHAPKTQFELQDMGIIWARAGSAVLVPDQLGYGERIQNYPWDREAHSSSYTLGIQLQLVNENLTKWRVWDNIRAVDLLLERKDINKDAIILIGCVAGGGDIAAVAAALDPRIGTVVPFNFGDAQPAQIRSVPEKNQWPLDLAYPGWGDMESTGVVPRALIDGFLPWLVCVSVAPRRFVYSYELGWKVEDEPAWARYQKVFGFYNSLDHLADAHGFGLMPGPGEAWNVGPAARRTLYPTFERWFGIPIPFGEMQSSVLDNEAKSPEIPRRPISELGVLTPSIASSLHMQTVHELARDRGSAEVNAARAELAKLRLTERVQWLREKWAARLGDITPSQNPDATVLWTKNVQIAQAEAITLTVEPGVHVPLLLLRPATPFKAKLRVAVAMAEGGKDLFLARRRAEIEALLKGGVAVCLPDVRGTGETLPNPKFDLDGDAVQEHNAGIEVMLGNTMLGKRLKDLRTVLAYLGDRQELDTDRIGLWGDSFAPVNPPHLLVDEQHDWQVGPEIEQQAEPLGGLLALLGALYEDRVQAIAVEGGLSSYRSILDDNFAYVPADAMVPGILKAGDIADVVAALVPRPVLLNNLVDGRDRLAPHAWLQDQFYVAYEAYKKPSPGALVLQSGQPAGGLPQWLINNLRGN